jgi:hypothetical protein
MRTTFALVLGLLLGFAARVYVTHDTCEGLGVITRKPALGKDDEVVICSKVPLPHPFSLDEKHLAGIVRSADSPVAMPGASQPTVTGAR